MSTSTLSSAGVSALGIAAGVRSCMYLTACALAYGDDTVREHAAPALCSARSSSVAAALTQASGAQPPLQVLGGSWTENLFPV